MVTGAKSNGHTLGDASLPRDVYFSLRVLGFVAESKLETQATGSMKRGGCFWQALGSALPSASSYAGLGFAHRLLAMLTLLWPANE